MKPAKFSTPLASSIALFLILSLLSSCQKGPDFLLDGIDTSVISFSLKSGDEILDAYIYPSSIVIRTDYNTDLSDAVCEIELSEGATISPDITTIKDWSNQLEFTVTSANGLNSKVYTYSVERASIGSYYQEHVYLRTQDEVIQFGTHNYTRVKSIIISDSEENQITDLSPLQSIITIDKNLTIKGYHGKEVILDNLTSVSTFDILSKDVQSISMESLHDVVNLYIGTISEEQNTSPTADSLGVTNFPSLQHVKGNLVLNFRNYNEGYAISGFENLSKIDGDIVFNFQSVHLKTFSNITKVRSLQLGGTIMSFEGLENLKEVTTLFATSYLRGGTTYYPFQPDKLYNVSLKGVQSLTSLEFLNNITELNSIEINGAYPITSLSGLENLKTINHGLFLAQTQISNLDELSNVDHIGNIISIQNNRMLDNYEGLKNALESFDGDWVIIGNKTNPTIEEILNN